MMHIEKALTVWVYQEQILKKPDSRTALTCQLENGWFGHGFHFSCHSVIPPLQILRPKSPQQIAEGFNRFIPKALIRPVIDKF